MIHKLKQYGFDRIVIADDTEENLHAAKQLGERLPGIVFEFYSRGDLLVAEIPKRHRGIGLILTDREMETHDAGLDVLETAWRYVVPAFVCSGGYQHANKPRLVITPDSKNFHIPDGMLKDNPDTWYMIIQEVVNIASKQVYSDLCALLALRQTGTYVPDDFYGERIRIIAKYELDIIHKKQIPDFKS
jgi:hypothetical protein